MKQMIWVIGSVLLLAGLSYTCAKAYEPPVKNEVLKQQSLTELRPVKTLHNINYSKIPMSQMDILLPEKIRKGDKLPLIIWTHGGGYIAGDKKHKNPYLSQLAEKGFIVANMNYALAPESKYPTPIKQQVAASEFLKKNRLKLPIDFNQIIIGGDSAGAQLASQFAAIQTNDRLRAEMKLKQSFNRHQLKAVILFGGLYNMDTVRQTKFPRIQLFMKSYTGVSKWEKDFLPINQLSTTQQVTHLYPPTFLTVGDADPFESQAEELIDVFKKNKVPYTASLFDGSHHLKHQYQFNMDLKESQLTYRKLLMFLGKHTNQTPYQSNTADKSIEFKSSE